MQKLFTVLAAGVLLALGLSAPASAAVTTAVEPFAVSFTVGCGFTDITVTNNSDGTVPYVLETSDDGPPPLSKGRLDFSLAAGATKTHRWPMRAFLRIRVTSPALMEPALRGYPENPANCDLRWGTPQFYQDCHGGALIISESMLLPQMGNPVVTVNGKPGTPFSPTKPHNEFVNGLKVGDLVGFQVPALSDPEEMVPWGLWAYLEPTRCSHQPPATVTFTCAGINVKTVNTEQASTLQIVVSRRIERFPLAQGQAFDHDLPAAEGDPIIIWWRQPWAGGGSPLLAVALAEYAKPQSCDNPPSSPATGGGQLPTTGAPTWLLASAGGLLLALGLALFALTRRRRLTQV